MSKIKVIQIAIAASTDDTWYAQYLDDKGRVWYNATQYQSVTGPDGRVMEAATGRHEWTQLDLPEEPES